LKNNRKKFTDIGLRAWRGLGIVPRRKRKREKEGKWNKPSSAYFFN